MLAFSLARVAAVATVALTVHGASAPSSAASPAPSPASDTTTATADFYVAKDGAVSGRELEMRLREDGEAWLVTAIPGTTTFETGMWTTVGATVRVVLDAIAPVANGSPASPSPERETLTFSRRDCVLELVTAAPTRLSGPGGLRFAKRHCS